MRGQWRSLSCFERSKSRCPLGPARNFAVALLSMNPLRLLFLWLAVVGAQTLPVQLVNSWAKLPPGVNLGETSGVAVDKDENVWVFLRSNSRVMKFDRTGKLLALWPDAPINLYSAVEAPLRGGRRWN